MICFTSQTQRNKSFCNKTEFYWNQVSLRVAVRLRNQFTRGSVLVQGVPKQSRETKNQSGNTRSAVCVNRGSKPRIIGSYLTRVAGDFKPWFNLYMHSPWNMRRIWVNRPIPCWFAGGIVHATVQWVFLVNMLGNGKKIRC